MWKIFKQFALGFVFVIYFLTVVFESNYWGNVLSPVVTFIAGYYIWYEYFCKEKVSYKKVAGFFLFLSIFNWFITDVIWGILNNIWKVDPLKLDFISYEYSFTNLCIAIFVFMIGFNEIKKWNRIQSLVDIISISICYILLIWNLFFNHSMQNVITLHSELISVLSIFLNFIIFFWIAIWFFSMRKSKMPKFLQFTLAGIMLFIFVDLLYYYQYFYSLYEPNTILDGCYVIAFMVIAYGAAKKKWEVVEDDSYVSYHAETANKGFFLLLAPIILTLFKGIQLQSLMIMILVIVFHFVFTNYIQNNINKDSIIIKERELNEYLEQRIKDRTEELTKKNLELDYLLNQDIVTGLYNRRYFLEKIQSEMQSTKDAAIILFYLDINKYKLINTMFGNYVVDKILMEMSRRLKELSFISKSSILAAYGEDTFVLTVKGSYQYQDANVMAEEIISKCSDVYQIEEYDIHVTLNIGISIYPFDAKTRKDLIQHADTAMTYAKNQGYNTYITYETELCNLIYKKNNIELLLKNANYEEEFMLYYQPQVRIADKKIIGFEALIRWKQKNGDFIPPGEFIPIAEETNLIIPIGDWVMRKALQQLALWNQNNNLNITIGINVSVKQLNGRNFINNLRAEIEKLNLKPEWVDIEITESIAIEDNLGIKDILKEIKEMGISISIDDFGTGYSSLNYLKDLPISRIKVAKPIIDEICHNEFDYVITKCVIEIAKAKNYNVIAEGVETQEQWDYLQKLKCDEVQGYFFAKPMPATEINEKYFISVEN